MTERVRFAPSPSGYLHVGGARTALFSWLWAKKTGGRFIVRIEDTDQERSSIESVRAILDALEWLGLGWDEGPEVGGDYAPYFQSERKDHYRAAADRLIASGFAFRCYCTKEELDAQRAALKAKNPKGEFVYPGTCRDKPQPKDVPHVVRFRAPKMGSTIVNDLVFGPVETPNGQLQDFVILRQNGLPLYNLACVVDDHEMAITMVGRGRDHLGNTPQQVLLYQALGYDLPKFAHLPMMLSAKGDKLSKRNADVSVADYRERGFTPMGVLNYLVRFGWSHGDQEIFSRDELIQHFSWDRVNKSDGKFDEKKFADVAFEQLKRPDLTDDENYLRGVLPFLGKNGILDPAPETLKGALPLIRERARSLDDAAHHLDFYFREPPSFDEKARKKFLTSGTAPILDRLSEYLQKVDESAWLPASLEEIFKTWVEAQGLKMKEVAQPTRVALTGRSASPGLFEVMQLLGKTRSVSRLRRASEIARES